MERRQKYDAKRQAYINRRTALEGKRKAAEDKLLKGVLSDEDFTRIRKELEIDLTQIDDELANLEGSRG